MKLTGEGRSLAKFVLGALFLFFGLNGFFQFVNMPIASKDADLFLAGLGSALYFFPLLKSVEILAGTLLLLNRRVGLALVMLVPIVINIVLFHLYLDRGGLGFSLILAGILSVACWENRHTLKVLVEDLAD